MKERKVIGKDLLPDLAQRKTESYDFVILDPPAFTKSRKTIHNAWTGYREINFRAMKLLPRGGLLATASCSHFMEADLFEEMLRDAAQEAGVQLRQIADQGKIIIVITHTPDRVIDLFDDVIVLAKDSNRTGRLAWFGPIKEAQAFFGKEKMEEIVKSVNREEEGGEGRADEFIMKYAEVQHG